MSEQLTFFRFMRDIFRVLVSRPGVTLKLMSPSRLRNFYFGVIRGNSSLSQLLKRYEHIYQFQDTQVDTECVETGTTIQDVIVFPCIDWHFRFQRPQHLSRQLGRMGCRVFYISTSPLIQGAQGHFLLQEVPEENVFLVRLHSGRFHLANFFTEEMDVNAADLFSESLQELMSEMNITEPIIIYQHPYWYKLASRFTSESQVYDCLDYFAGFYPDQKAQILHREKSLINDVDTIIASSEPLKQHVSQFKSAITIRNGCEFEFFAQVSETGNKARPKIGFVGAVAEWFDIQLVVELALLRPDWDFDVYGSFAEQRGNVPRNVPNLCFHGEVPYESVAGILATFDVGIIPFKITEMTKFVNPVKVYEYLAAGKPVVSSPLPELEGLEHLDVLLASGSTQFAEKIQEIFDLLQGPESVDRRRMFAKENDWALVGAKFYENIIG